MNSGFGRLPSRRQFLNILGRAVAALPFGFSLLSVQTQSAPSVVFADVTAAAGLSRAVNIFGDPANKQFLLEENGLWRGAVRL